MTNDRVTTKLRAVILKMLIVTLLSIAAVVVPALSGMHYMPKAHADPKPGLWQEGGETAIDGVNFRKVRDTTGGDFNVCYLAFRTTGAGPAAPALACVAERRP